MSLKRTRSNTLYLSTESAHKRARVDAPPIYRSESIGTLNIVPRPIQSRAFISGSGMWGNAFRLPVEPTHRGFTIGRMAPSLHIDVRDYTMSRSISHIHCVIIYNKATQHFELENRGRNGTRVNGTVVGRGGRYIRKHLEHDDVITVGDLSMTFKYVNPPKSLSVVMI
jgi:hypothetical protein